MGHLTQPQPQHRVPTKQVSAPFHIALAAPLPLQRTPSLWATGPLSHSVDSGQAGSIRQCLLGLCTGGHGPKLQVQPSEDGPLVPTAYVLRHCCASSIMLLPFLSHLFTTDPDLHGCVSLTIPTILHSMPCPLCPGTCQALADLCPFLTVSSCRAGTGCCHSSASPQ